MKNSIGAFAYMKVFIFSFIQMLTFSLHNEPIFVSFLVSCHPAITDGNCAIPM